MIASAPLGPARFRISADRRRDGTRYDGWRMNWQPKDAPATVSWIDREVLGLENAAVKASYADERRADGARASAQFPKHIACRNGSRAEFFRRSAPRWIDASQIAGASFAIHRATSAVRSSCRRNS